MEFLFDFSFQRNDGLLMMFLFLPITSHIEHYDFYVYIVQQIGKVIKQFVNRIFKRMKHD